MIYIIHGEDTISSRNFILKLQKDNNVSSKTELDIGDTTPEEALTTASTIDMFGNTVMAVLNITKMGRMNVDAFIESFQNVPNDGILVIYSEKELSKANKFVKSATTLGARVVLYKKSKESDVFKFVDLVFNKNREGAYKELRRLMLVEEDPFYMLAMLTWGLRNVSLAKFESLLFNKMAPFTKSKAKKQATNFTEEELKGLYSEFYKLDMGAKLGTVPKEMIIPVALEKVLTL